MDRNVPRTRSVERLSDRVLAKDTFAYNVLGVPVAAGVL
jgi:hypothetical protein